MCIYIKWYFLMSRCENVCRYHHILTHSIRDSETSIDIVHGPPGSRRERVKWNQWVHKFCGYIFRNYHGCNQLHNVEFT